MIIRNCQKRDFAIVPNALLNDCGLSWKAKGILAYLLSKPDGWELRRADLANHSKDGITSVDAGLVELRKAGYVKREWVRVKGKVDGVEYRVYDKPIEESERDNFKERDGSETPESGFPKTVTRSLSNTDRESNTEKEKERIGAKASRSPVQPDLLSGNGSVDEEELTESEKGKRLRLRRNSRFELSQWGQACAAAQACLSAEEQVWRLVKHCRESKCPLSYGVMVAMLRDCDGRSVDVIKAAVDETISRGWRKLYFRGDDVQEEPEVEEDPLTIDEKDARYVERWGERYEEMRDRLLGEGKSREFAVTVPGEVLENAEKGD